MAQLSFKDTRTHSNAAIVRHALRTVVRAHHVGTGQGTAHDAALTAGAVLRLLESLTAIYGPAYGGPMLQMAAQLQRDLVAGLESAAARKPSEAVAAGIATHGDSPSDSLSSVTLPDWLFEA